MRNDGRMNRLTKWLKHTIKAGLFRGYIIHHRLLHNIGVLPYSRNFGFERGTPVGRHYVESFFRKHASSVRGRCLDFGDDRYRSFFPLTSSYEVINLTPGDGVDYVCDVHDVTSMPQAAFDSIICPQVFEHLAWPEKAAESIKRLLKPGGILLLTAPFINPVHYVPTDYRRFTPECLAMILEDAGLVIDEISFGGNSLVGTGSLLGMVVQDFSKRELDHKDPVYPYNVLVRAHRPED
jgi:SAM-dependent methyltransferase